MGYIGGCSSLTEIRVDSDNQFYKSINGALFTKSETELIAYPAGKESEKYSIPSNVQTIGICAFEGCKYLKNVIIPNSVTNIRSGAFQSCEELIEISIPSSVSELGSQTFAYCTNLETAIIHEGITNLNWFTFEKCSNLKSAYIPKSVIVIGDEWGDVFGGCDSLSDVYYSGADKDWLKIKISDEEIKNATIHYNCAFDDISEVDPENNTIQINFKGQIMDIVWNDDLFNHSPYEYDNNIAIAALALSGEAENDTSAEVENLLKQMGFDPDIKSNKYGEDWNSMQPAHSFATKRVVIDGKLKTLVAVVVRGSKSPADWVITDAIDGTGVGFTNSALYLADELDRYLVENAGYTQEHKEDFVFLITGHSLGGAVAAYLTELCIMNNIVPQENVFSYTFAAPRYFTNVFKQYKNLFEVINKWDIVPNIGYPGSPLGTGHDGVFVEFIPYNSMDFANFLNKWFPDFILFPFDKQHNHGTEIYMAQLLANPPSVGLKKGLSKSYFISVRCPVNVEFYDSDGTLLAKVVNNKVDEDITNDSVFCNVDGDEKYFFVESDKEIYVKLTGTDSGTMEYSVQSLKAVDEVVTEDDFVTYETVELEAGKIFFSEISEKNNSTDINLYVVDPETNKPIKSVGLDGTESRIAEKNHTWFFISTAVIIVVVAIIFVFIFQKRHKKQ